MWQQIKTSYRQWREEMGERWRYFFHVTRYAWYVVIGNMLLIGFSSRIAFLDFLDEWIFGIGSFINLLCIGYLCFIYENTAHRPEDWEDFE